MMTADGTTAKISITLSHKDVDLQKKCFDKLLQFKNVLHLLLSEQWHWMELGTDQHGKVISEIHTSIQQVQVLNKNDWPPIISFFKERLVALDKFWCEYKYAFERTDF